MARILFFPVFLALLGLVIFLILRIMSMFGLSKSKDIVLHRPAPFPGDPGELAGEMLESLKSLSQVEYRSEILTDFRKITTYSKIGEAGYCKATAKSRVIEITREKSEVVIKSGNKDITSLPCAENPWIDFWCGTRSLEESLRLFYEGNFKVQAGNVGVYMDRKYSELLVLSHALPDQANQAFDACFSHMSPVYGKNLAQPGMIIRNFMFKILVNNLTAMPDYIEIKFNVFRDTEFVCDYLQNSRLLY